MTMTFGEKIREARKKLNMSQDDLAEKIGVSRRTITSWETGRALPRTRNVYEKLSEALNTSGLLSLSWNQKNSLATAAARALKNWYRN